MRTNATDPDVLRDAARRREAAGESPTVMSKNEDGERGGPVWMRGPGDELVPLATTEWDADDEGPAGSAPAWFPAGYAREYATKIGAELEEW